MTTRSTKRGTGMLVFLLMLPALLAQETDAPATSRDAHLEGWFEETSGGALDAALVHYRRALAIADDREMTARALWRIGMIAQDVETGDGHHARVVDRLEVVESGEMSPGEYRRAARDLAGFLTYVGEPAKLVRYSLGLWVLAFLAGFFVLTRALYKEYWRDVH